MLAHYWWTFTPFLLFFGALDGWLFYVRKQYLLSIKWVLLEIKPPPDVQKSPKIAENIFAGLHALYTGSVSWKDEFFKGKVQPWLSFEIVGNGGETNFYIRTPEDLRNLIEAQIFAQYPDAEIKIADDYITQLPEYLPNDEYDLFGTELVFTRPDAYPIKTYPFFEEESGKDEFKRTDPLAPLAEIMSALESGEHIWLQLTIRATGDAWVKEAKTEVDKIIGKEPKVERGSLGKVVDFIDLLLPGGTPVHEEKKKDEFSLQKLTPGQKFTLDQVENKISKLGFKSGYRFFYIARKDRFHGSHISAVMGMLKQFYLNNLNSFKPNKKTITKDKGWFSWLFPSDKGFFYREREYRRKWHLYQKYRERAFVGQFIILNTEELATLFHLPGIGVKAPAFPRVEAKKGQPPAGLPTR
ncbi:MAG: hypothetical protein HYX20_02740 [Candidatus Yanofskybacteria bacterium]|nr:hypothetical protein [Candidatus Yanofskybacteria bacterium]